MTDLIPGPTERSAATPGTPEADDPWDRWLGQYEPLTREAYRRDLGQWQDWLLARGRSIDGATVGDVNAWNAHLRTAGMAERTRAKKLSAIASFFIWARDEGLTTNNPMPRRRPSSRPRGDAKLGVAREQAQRLHRAAEQDGARSHALVAVLLFGAVRIAEAVGADIGDLRDEAGYRYLRLVGKGNKVRKIPVTPPMHHALTLYHGDRIDGPLFLAQAGGRLDRREAWRIVHRIGEIAGVKVHPHLLRHTAATLALDAGTPIDRVQAWLGHASVDTTMGYVRARDQLALSPAHDLARYLAEDG
jgi:integrase/recombinase XerD